MQNGAMAEPVIWNHLTLANEHSPGKVAFSQESVLRKKEPGGVEFWGPVASLKAGTSLTCLCVWHWAVRRRNWGPG